MIRTLELRKNQTITAYKIGKKHFDQKTPTFYEAVQQMRCNREILRCEVVEECCPAKWRGRDRTARERAN